jgi:ABC-2 type transport system permease protein
MRPWEREIWARETLADARGAATAFRLGLSAGLGAWPALIGRVVFYGVCLMVLGAFWNRVGAARLPGTLATRLPPGGLAPYIGVTEWITISVVAVQLRFEDEVRSGALEARLLRPRSWVILVMAEALGGTAARLLALGAGGLGLLALAGLGGGQTPRLGAAALAQAGVLGVAGAAIGVQLYTLVGLSAFWLRRVLPAMLIMQKLMFLLGGLFAPIALYRGWFHALAAASPFAAHLAFAGQALLTPSWSGFGRALATQALWAAGLAALIALIGRAGIGKALREGAG